MLYLKIGLFIRKDQSKIQFNFFDDNAKQSSQLAISQQPLTANANTYFLLSHFYNLRNKILEIFDPLPPLSNTLCVT